MKVREEYYVSLKGKRFPLYAGVLIAATESGLRRLETDLIQIPSEENDHVAIVRARAEFEDGRVYIDYGDCSPRNCAPMIATASIRMASCVPLSARALTRSGWSGADRLEIGQEILAYDPERDLLRWTPLQAIHRFDTPQRLLSLASRSFRATCTPDHSWATRSQAGVPKLVETAALKNHHLVVAAPAESGDHPLTEREAAILGWIATDGSARMQKVGQYGPYLRVKINQSKPEYVSELHGLLRGLASIHSHQPMPRDFGSYVSDCLPSFTFDLQAQFARDLLTKAGLYDKQGLLPWTELTPLVLSLSQPARAAMLAAMLKGDGSRKRASDAWSFGKKRKPGVMEAWELLATLEGNALGIVQPRVGRDCRTMRANRLVGAAYLQQTSAPAQAVWCPQTRFGTWLMRDGEQITITGNTRAKGRALRDGIGLGETLREEIGEELDNTRDDDHHDDGNGRSAPAGEAARGRGRPPVSAPRPVPSGREPESRESGGRENFCAQCGVELTAGQRTTSIHKHGVPYCLDCRKDKPVTAGIA